MVGSNFGLDFLNNATKQVKIASKRKMLTQRGGFIGVIAKTVLPLVAKGVDAIFGTNLAPKS